ncbi:hypothetical protein AWB73_06888 [Caballeronia turbans]|nr:hypothetical protein AWB73_06888 [Caballeronia turbans]
MLVANLRQDGKCLRERDDVIGWNGIHANGQDRGRQPAAHVAKHVNVIESLELKRAHVGLRLRKIENVAQFLRAEIGTDLIRNRPYQFECEEHDGKFDAVRHL